MPGAGSTHCQKNYLEESSEDFAQRMKWFTDEKYGMFIHFGLYSQLGGIYQRNDQGKYAEWIQANQQIPKSDYVKLIETWTPHKFNADKIAKLAKKAEYVSYLKNQVKELIEKYDTDILLEAGKKLKSEYYIQMEEEGIPEWSPEEF